MILLRIMKRRTSLELTDLEEVCAVEFRTRTGELDLRLSVYEVQDKHVDIVRAYTEHCANVPLTPPCGGPCLHLGGLGVVISNPSSRFAFTRDAHREICLDDETELFRGIGTVFAEMVARKRHASREDVKGYVHACLSANDPEWLSFLEGNSAWKKWGGIRHL